MMRLTPFSTSLYPPAVVHDAQVVTLMVFEASEVGVSGRMALVEPS